MPRKLPWENTSSTPARPKKVASGAAKRQKIQDEKNGRSSPKMNTDARAPSSSPPPEPAKEEYMDEGIEWDDKYRMVEDEFLTIAKRFTVHIHAAEYQRQQKWVKSRKAETISSISRPVTGKMPDHTKRRVEAGIRAKAQKAALEGVLPKNDDGSYDSDDGEGLPYFGTTLHGLMESPRKKAASLANFGKIAASTRAAAGFKQSGTHSRPTSKGTQESPPSKIAVRTAKAALKDDESTESLDDDDLDAPIPAPKLTAAVLNLSMGADPYVKSSTSISKTLEKKSADASASNIMSSKSIIQTTKFFPPSKQSSLSTRFSSFSDVDSRLSDRLSDTDDPFSVKNFRPSRVEKARRKKAILEKEQEEKNKLDIIPTFL